MVFGGGGSNGVISGSIKRKMAAMSDRRYRQEPSDVAFCQITLSLVGLIKLLIVRVVIR